MRCVVQRVSHASVTVEGKETGKIGWGLLAYVAAHRDDTAQDAEKLADRLAGIRIFSDDEGKMNRDLASTDGAVLAISNFTLYGDAMGSRRPSFVASAPYEGGQELFDAFVQALRSRGVRTETGVFGAHMHVDSVNDGPVTLVLDTR